MKPWGGRFSGETNKQAESFTSSLSFDRRLYRQDIQGSIAHTKMLAARGIISQDEGEAITRALGEILQEIESGTFPFRTEFEDIHLNIERRLIEKVGPVGGKVHTARSRNDQVALDEHMYVKEAIREVQQLLTKFQATLLQKAEEHLETVMPGYTHLQHAQPVVFGHHLMAYFAMMNRDYDRLEDLYKRADVMPLGAGALAGTSFPIDPEMVARDLGFKDIYANSMDAVSDRDFILEFLFDLSTIMMHLSRLCEEFIIWSSTEFRFLEMDDAFATGSSIMPQKKNPDVAELIRGKTGRVYGDLVALLTVMKGLPLAYHSDMQEDKERLFDAIDTVKACLEMASLMVGTVKVKKDRMRESVNEGFSSATDVADYLAKKGMPFRQAHEVVGRIVKHCIEKSKHLEDMEIEEYKSFSPLFEEDIFELLSPEACVAARVSYNGTAPERVKWQILAAKESLAARESFLKGA